jgi:DNA-binding MarR family transcriptional regulator
MSDMREPQSDPEGAPRDTAESVQNRPDPTAALEALRAYRAAEAAMRRRTGKAIGISESDFLALRFVIARWQIGKVTNAKDIATYMGISTASTSGLIDRLEKGAFVERRAGQTDRRATEIIPSPTIGDDKRLGPSDTDRRVLEAAMNFSAADIDVISRFLDGMRNAVDEIGVSEKPSRRHHTDE